MIGDFWNVVVVGGGCNRRELVGRKETEDVLVSVLGRGIRLQSIIWKLNCTKDNQLSPILKCSSNFKVSNFANCVFLRIQSLAQLVLECGCWMQPAYVRQFIISDPCLSSIIEWFLHRFFLRSDSGSGSSSGECRSLYRCINGRK